MAFTAADIAHHAAAAIEWHDKTKPLSQTIQDKPLLDAVMSNKKTFSGGNEYITGGVKGEYTKGNQGYTDDDTVTYQAPNFLKRWKMPWKEIHRGWKVSGTRLKIDGLSVVDSNLRSDPSAHSGREMHVLANIFEDILDDFKEGWARDFNQMLWMDGTQDPNEIAGIRYFIRDNPTTGIVANIDSGANVWWRNRSLVNNSGSGGSDQRINVGATAASTPVIIDALHPELRQLRRYGGRPSRACAGADWMERIEKEAARLYNPDGKGFTGTNDVTYGQVTWGGITFKYDPTLDDLGMAKRCYVMDPRHLRTWVMQGEDMKQHNPSRPHNQYVYYRATTFTGGLCADMLNCHAVYEFK